ncbi:MAG: hypothetical protein FI682_03015 [SAR202 cluster bacterium]|nr:hypothetical protein [SAR202 cluster bacterium]OUU76621.1 MAG: hypothetical protein CBC30_03375 [Chloroflexi bacterium TMED70]|tara:strand:+ start:39647 stop:39856 length:210 start_codon:yes stop_codon:yes gene_type:complete
MFKKENLDDLSVTQLSDLAEKVWQDISDLYDKEDSEQNDEKIQEMTNYFNDIKRIIRDLHSDESYPRGG